MKTLFVTGTDTGVGKTWVSSLIVRRFRALGLRVGAYKPVCSGALQDSHGLWQWDDLNRLRHACGTCPPIDLVCPQRFIACAAPNVAARLEESLVDDRLLSTGVQAWKAFADWLVIEGAGGVYCPLSDVRSVLDLALELNGPVVIVAANKLGTINHTRLTVAALQSHGLSIAAIVLNELEDPAATVPMHSESPWALSLETNAQQLRHWVPDVPLCYCDWRSCKLKVLSKSNTGAYDELLWSLLTSDVPSDPGDVSAASETVTAAGFPGMPAAPDSSS